MEKNKNILSPNSKNQTPIHLASLNGSLEFIEKYVSILAHEISSRELEKPDIDGRTPLMLSSINGHLNIFNYLLKLNVNVKQQDNLNRDSILHLLVKLKQNKILEFLLKWNDFENKLDINIKNNKERTALNCAGHCCNDEAIYILCSFEANTSLLDNDKHTPLELAILSESQLENKESAILALIKCGADYSNAENFCKSNLSEDTCTSPLNAIVKFIRINGEFKASHRLSEVNLNKITNLVFQGGSLKGKIN